MDEFLDWVQHKFGFVDAVVLKNMIIGISFYILGMFTIHLYASYINSILIKDCENKYKLDELGISFLIIRVDGKKKIVCHSNMTMKESFFGVVIVSLIRLRILRNNRITKKDEKKALILFMTYSIICFFIVFFSFLLTFTIQQPGHVYKFRELFGL